MDVEPDVYLAEGRLVLMLDSVPEQEVLTQVEADAELDGFEDAHEGDAAQAAADAARVAHQELVASIVQDTEARLSAQYDTQLARLLEATTTRLSVQQPPVAERQKPVIDETTNAKSISGIPVCLGGVGVQLLCLRPTPDSARLDSCGSFCGRYGSEPYGAG